MNYSEGGHTQVGIDLKQIYIYFINHPLCNYRQISYPEFAHFYTKWINKN